MVLIFYLSSHFLHLLPCCVLILSSEYNFFPLSLSIFSLHLPLTCHSFLLPAPTCYVILTRLSLFFLLLSLTINQSLSLRYYSLYPSQYVMSHSFILRYSLLTLFISPRDIMLSVSISLSSFSFCLSHSFTVVIFFI